MQERHPWFRACAQSIRASLSIDAKASYCWLKPKRSLFGRSTFATTMSSPTNRLRSIDLNMALKSSMITLCRDLGLPSGGKKPQLVAMLRTHLASLSPVATATHSSTCPTTITSAAPASKRPPPQPPARPPPCPCPRRSHRPPLPYNPLRQRPQPPHPQYPIPTNSMPPEPLPPTPLMHLPHTPVPPEPGCLPTPSCRLTPMAPCTQGSSHF